MSGVVTTQHLVTQAHRIIRGFGFSFYLRCVFAVLAQRRVTFLHLLGESAWRRRLR